MKKETDSYIIFSDSLALRNLIFPPPLLHRRPRWHQARGALPLPSPPSKTPEKSDRRHPDRQTYAPVSPACRLKESLLPSTSRIDRYTPPTIQHQQEKDEEKNKNNTTNHLQVYRSFITNYLPPSLPDHPP